MITIKITGHSNKIDLETAWNKIIDIEKYPQRVKYVKKVKVHNTGLGSKWDDITTILWIPIKMRHTVNYLQKNKEYGFKVYMYFGGCMEQKYTLSQKDKKLIIHALITFDLGNKLLNASLGFVLKKRLRNMLISNFKKNGAEIYPDNRI
ncbi:hypothetical protein KJ980_04995 [Patescibacteria group bacterium]|nr:hypothetical protein [Patescibacteria group bacterium]MBU4017095.1 hypothetical protein [Patescibacteria group bacterium]MBU4098976.1 hypothetical protein [Patescibacteria group bacterium]